MNYLGGASVEQNKSCILYQISLKFKENLDIEEVTDYQKTTWLIHIQLIDSAFVSYMKSRHDGTC